MSQKALPIAFINLSGEMMYILDQRLRAQNITKEKSDKVMTDIVSTMFNYQFVEELFKPQDLYTKKALRTVFEKLVHSSIMRLNGTSMDKLYDLMTMVCKYQLTLCPRSEDILLITLNHLDGIRKYTEESEEMTTLVDNVSSLLYDKYVGLSAGEFQLLQYTLFTFFQDLHIRVSMLLKIGAQRASGKFAMPKGGPVPHGFDIPGRIRAFGTNGEVMTTKSFLTEYIYQDSLPIGSLEKDGDRRMELGKNIYLEQENLEEKSQAQQATNQKYLEDKERNYKNACEELSFLGRLIGQKEVRNHQSEFTLGIFDDESLEVPSCSLEENRVVSIDVSQKRMEQTAFHKIIGDLTIEEKEFDDCDILELLDVAST